MSHIKWLVILLLVRFSDVFQIAVNNSLEQVFLLGVGLTRLTISASNRGGGLPSGFLAVSRIRLDKCTRPAVVC